MPPRGSKTPTKPRPKPKPLKSPKKKPVSSAFIDDEAEDSDYGVVVNGSDAVEGPPASDNVDVVQPNNEDSASEDRYDEDFINDGDPDEELDIESLGYPSPSPPPSAPKASVGNGKTSSESDFKPTENSPTKRIHRRAETPVTPSPRKAPASASAENVIELASSSDEDLEAMDVDDTMFKKPSSVKPSALPPSLLTRSAAVKLGVKLDADSSAPPSTPEPKRVAPSARTRGSRQPPEEASKSSSAILGAMRVLLLFYPTCYLFYILLCRDPSELDEDTARRLGDLVNAFLKENKSKKHNSKSPPSKSSAGIIKKHLPRVDHDQLALDEALKNSVDSDPVTPPPTTFLRELSEDWDPPFSGNVLDDVLRTPISLYNSKSSPSKSKGKARYVSPDRMIYPRLPRPTPSASVKKSVLLPADATVVKSRPVGKPSSSTKRKQPETSDAEVEASAPAPRRPDGTPEKRRKSGFAPATPPVELDQYLVKIPRPAASAGGGETNGGPPLTMAQFMRASKGDLASTEDVDEAQYPSGDEANLVFLEDLESYKAYFNPKAPCGVFDLDLQDESLRSHYVGLPPLPSGRRVVAAYDKSRNSHDDIDFSTGGHVRFSSWYAQNPQMLAANSMGAILFERAEPNFINLSRVSPLDLGTRVSAGSSSTHRLYYGDRIAICVSAICCTESHVVVPKRIGAKSDRERKWIEGVLHDQDYERWESCTSLCFHANILYAQIRDKAIQFQTMISPDVRNEQSSSSQSVANVPASMFSSGSPKKSSPSKSRSAGATKTLLAYNDPIPVYDARKIVINFDSDLSRLDQVLPLFPGEIPSGSFTVVGYTMASYMASLSGGAERVPHVGCNILWAIVCGTPGIRRIASSSKSKS
ncbi:hypothetical protein C8R47DRAFT_1229578 [Mycena vitilis]|nr:hypothetical protein C8R47DRAFT_1229578 [Mycena vitilis]